MSHNEGQLTHKRQDATPNYAAPRTLSTKCDGIELSWLIMRKKWVTMKKSWQILKQSCASRVLVDWWFYHHKLPHSSAATSTIFYSSYSLQFESCKAVTFLILFKCVTPFLKAKLYLLKSSSWVKCKYYVMWCDVMTALTEEKVCVIVQTS